MEIASGLMDGIGLRLTGSPNMRRANDWTMKKLEEFGLANAHLEAWSPFGRGWSYESCSVRLVSPDVAQLEALPRAWTAPTNGPVRAQVVHARATKSGNGTGKSAASICRGTSPSVRSSSRGSSR